MQRALLILLCVLMAAAPCCAAVRSEKKPKMTMAERKEQARLAAEERREQAKARAEERRLKNRSKAEREADEQAAQQAEAEARHAAELEAAETEEKLRRAAREKRETLAGQEHRAAVRRRLLHRKYCLTRLDVRKGEEWTVKTAGLKAFSSMDLAQKYMRLAEEDPEEAQIFAEEEEDDGMILVGTGGHLVVKATNADSILPAEYELKDRSEEDELAHCFDTRKAAIAYLRETATARGIVRVVSRRKREHYVLYRDLLSMATPPEREELPEEEEETPQEEELQEEYEYGDDLL